MPREIAQFEHARLPVGDLTPNPRNARKHPAAQVATIAAAIAEFGFTNPVLVDEHHVVLAGHGRLLAARKLGMADVPCIVIPGLSEAQRRALVIADNQIAANATWDEDLLRAELGELSAEGFDMALTGFDAAELDSMLNPAPEPTPEFKSYDETIEVEHKCPKCGYSWSGGARSRTRTEIES